jgi:dephospho-CoA kinase
MLLTRAVLPHICLPDKGRAMQVVAVVGMAGSGKSEVAGIFERSGFKKVRFGDITEEEIRNRGLELNEENERHIREQLRKEHGMAAYARLNLPRIDASLDSSDVVIDGLYSWEEYIFLKDYYGERFTTVAVWASQAVRHSRLANRTERPLTAEEAASRDKAEIENTNKGGPIAMADFTIINEASLKKLERETGRVISALKWKR